MRERARWCAVLLTLACVLSPSSPAVARGASASSSGYCADQHKLFKPKTSFVGIADGQLTVASTAFRGCSFGRMAANHIGIFRAGIEWPSVEWYPGQYNYTLIDGLVTQLAQHHMTLLPAVFGTPAWLSTAPQGAQNPTAYPPADPSQFGAFIALLVKRYGPHGSFWSANRKLPYHPIHSWQIWNEPNLIAYWKPKPNASAYVKLLHAAYVAIKKADRHASVVTGGMPALSATEEPTWLRSLFKAGMRGNYDVLAIHLYGPSSNWAINRLKTARQIMNRHGGRKKSLWVTEFGWAGGPPDAYAVSAHGQSVELSQFLRLVGAERQKLGIGELIWYGWQDKVYGPEPTWWGYHLGLYTTGLRAKPALKVLSNAAARFDAPLKRKHKKTR
jgi:hypothetical protein